MILLLIMILLSAVTYLLFYQFGLTPSSDKAHLPAQVFTDNYEIGLKGKDLPLIKPKKTWAPLSSQFKSYEQRLSAKSLRRKLIKAGSPIGILEFLVFKVLSLIIIPALGLAFLGGMFEKNIIIIVALAIGFLLPEIWLRQKIKKRQHIMRRELPNVIDLLSLCVSGGLDFMLAVNRVVKELRRSDLTEELSEVYRAIQIGETRRDALKAFAWRVDMPEIHSFVRTLVQADRMGSPMAEALKMQSEEIRVKRFHYGESMALKAPIKLLFPLFAFILPVVLIIVGAPIVLQFLRNTGSGGLGGF